MFIRSMICTVGLLLLTVATQADDRLPITTDATGNWYEPDRPGHGLQIEVLDLSLALVAWYTFDDNAEPLWLFGIGEIRGDLIQAEMYRYRGTRFPPDFDPAEIDRVLWGDLQFRLTGCDAGTIAYAPVDEFHLPAEFPLERLTRIDGSTCPAEPRFDQTVRFDLDGGRQQFQALFLDYPDGEEDFFELDWGHSQLPGVWTMRNGIRITGTNRSDDLMMVLMRPLDGLEPDTSYRIELAMQFATNVPSGCVGVGGSPGESVFMRLGASSVQPDYELVDAGPESPPMRRANIDLGQQSQPGEYALSAGDMANGLDESWCGDPDAPWRLKRVSTAGQPFEITSDENGRIWVYGLSDSGFEATTTWYLTEFVVRVGRLDE